MAKEIDREILEVVEGLGHEWKIDSFQRAGMGWIANISSPRAAFQLVSDRFYIDVSRLIDGKTESIPPPEKWRLRITPLQVVDLIRAELNDRDHAGADETD